MCGQGVNRPGLQASPIACFHTAGGNPAVDKHLIQGGGGSGNTARHASCKENLDELWPFGPLACVRLYLNFVLIQNTVN